MTDIGTTNEVEKRGPGAGRKKGALNKNTIAARELGEKLHRLGKSPLKIMLKNMRRFDNDAEELYRELQDLIASSKPSERAPYEQKLEYIHEVLALLARKRECTMDAQRCATDAAPYVHPKVGMIEAPKDTGNKLESKSEADMSKDELRDYYNNLRIRPLSLEPLEVVSPAATTIDNETGDVVPETEDYLDDE